VNSPPQASIPQFEDYFQDIPAIPPPDLRGQNPFEEKSFVDEIIAEVHSLPLDFPEVNDQWYKSALTKAQGLLFESRAVEIGFAVSVQKSNVALVKVTIRARSPVVVRAVEAVDNVVGTVRVEMGFR
jgi:hypothetical protein